MIGIIDNPIVTNGVGTLFGAAAQGIRENISEAFEEEFGEGQESVREEAYTREMVRQMRRIINGRLEELTGQIAETGYEVSIEFLPSQLKKEDVHGADIGIRVTVEVETAALVKGVLIQCKRMFGPPESPTYRELRGRRGQEQARKMLRITPASFFMLFNAGDQDHLLQYASVPDGMVCPVESDGRIPRNIRERGVHECSHWRDSAGSIWDMGVAIIPAARVLALSAKARIAGRSQIPVDAATILRGSLPLGVFVVDLFASCFVGDPRYDVVRLVTPPGKRIDNYPQIGLTLEDFDDFGVRDYIDIRIRQTEG